MKQLQQPATGRPAAKSLFLQNNPEGIYDLDEFHKRFVEIEDVTEYQAAIALVGSWAEWERIKQNYQEFVGFIADWVLEVELKIKSKCIKKIVGLANSKEKEAFQAAKFLATQEYKRRPGAGRPSKAEVEREVKQIAKAAADTKDEKERMLRVLQGGNSAS